MTKSNKPLIKHIPDFLDYCEVEKGLSNNTQKNYQRYLNKFKFWLEKNNKKNIKPHQLSPDEIWKYRLFLSRYINPKTNKPLKFLTLEQIKKLLSAPDIKNAIGLRDRAILEILFSTGLRIAELTALNREQFANINNKKDYELSIIGKGGYPRTVYFSERALFWLKKYLKSRQDKEKPLFIHYRAKKNADARLTARSIERIVKKYSILAGVPVFTTPHTLRHSMATDLLNQGVDLRTIQEFLGHRSISSTQIYTHITNKRLRDIHRKFHSGKNL